MQGEDGRRGLPQVQRLLEGADALCAEYGRDAVTTALREILGRVRSELGASPGRPRPDKAALLAEARAYLAARGQRGLRRVINATGILLHTNLGRAPLAAAALEAVQDAARSYCNLEFDVASGRRGARLAALEPLLRELTGAEAALAVNNGAAAILLALSALAGGGEVIVSRGELVEIGGGFRIPDVIQQGGARLVEVGATNRTRLADYRAAIGPQTRVLLKVHQSNFRTIGFTGAVEIAELAGLGRAHGLLTVADLGSGLLREVRGVAEPTLRAALGDGADLVTCSGDKLLGGPQAGLILGRSAAVEPLRAHPLLRAVRLDKMSLAALETTLMLQRDRPAEVPVLRMLGQSEAVLKTRAQRMAGLLGAGELVRTEAFAGGGALPEAAITSWAVALEGGTDMARRLREQRPAVVGRVADGRVLLDMLAVADGELVEIAEAVRALA